MKPIRHVIPLIAGCIALLGITLAASPGFKFESTVLYQSSIVLRTRLRAQDLSAYIKRLDAVCTAFFAFEKMPERLDIVVGLKPQKKVKVWFVSSRRSSEDISLIALRKKLESVTPCTVDSGPVAFAMRCTIAGGFPERNQSGDHQLPVPEEWREATEHLKGPVIIPEGVFPVVWPDK